VESGISEVPVVGHSGFTSSAAAVPAVDLFHQNFYTLLRHPGCLDVLPGSNKARE